MIKLLVWLFLLALLLALSSAIQQPYNEQDALEYISVASLSYCGTVQKIRNDECWDATKLTKSYGIDTLYAGNYEAEFSNKIVYVITKQDHKKRIIAGWTGTRSTEQLLTEGVLLAMTDYDIHNVEPDTRAVKYFDKFYDRIRSQYISDLTKALNQYPDYTLTITGHSLGGALSMHAAIDCILGECISEDKLSVYTYGTPRVGNYKFSRIITDR